MNVYELLLRERGLIKMRVSLFSDNPLDQFLNLEPPFIHTLTVQYHNNKVFV